MDGSLHTIDGRSVLRFERRLPHPPAKVWRAITEPAELSRWFPSDVEMVDFRVGGKIRFVFREDEGPTSEGTIIELDPPHRFTYTWDSNRLSWELRPDGQGCHLIFTHTFDDRAGAASFATGWQGCLDGLEAVLAGRPVEFPSGYAERHEAYVEAFGLLQGSATRADGGWTVRFERQLTRPVDEVWAELTKAEDAAPGTTAPTTPDTTADTAPDATPGTTVDTTPGTTAPTTPGTAAGAAPGGGPAVGAPPPVRLTNPYVAAGATTAVDPPALLEYDWLDGDRPAGRVRWELSPGPGGARLALTQTIPAALGDLRPLALAAWHTHIELLADHLRGRTRCPWPQDRTEELRERYAGLVG